MKREDNSRLPVSLVLVAACLFVFAGQSFVNGEEAAYDEDTYGPANPIVWTKPVKAVIFSHKIHTMGAGLDCDSCHDGSMFEMAAGTAEERADFTMESLYAGKYCGACHDGNTAFASNTRCTACHIGVKGHGRMMGGDAAQKKSGGH